MASLEYVIGDKPILHLFVKRTNAQLVDQPAGYPKIEIDKITAVGKTSIVISTTMTEDVNGEYKYEWDTTGEDAGYYKARYESKVDWQSAYGFDIIRLKSTAETYDGYGV